MGIDQHIKERTEKAFGTLEKSNPVQRYMETEEKKKYHGTEAYADARITESANGIAVLKTIKRKGKNK